MQSPIYAKEQRTGSLPPPQDHKLNSTCKSPNPYQNVAFIVKVYRKLHITALPQQKTNKSRHPPLQSPCTRVYGKRGVYDKSNNTLTTYVLIYIKVHLNPLTQNMSTNYASLSTSFSKQKICQDKHKNQRNQHFIDHNECSHTLHKTNNLTLENHSRETMTGQGKGAARDLLEDPNFVMMETISPPQGQKRTGSSKAASEEKRSRAASIEKRNKAAAKEKHAATPHFWLGFEAMEKLAIEDGSPPNLESNSTKKGRSDKEAA